MNLHTLEDAELFLCSMAFMGDGRKKEKKSCIMTAKAPWK